MIIPDGARNITFVGHTDQGGRGDGVQVMVHRSHAYIGTRVSRGITVTDMLRDLLAREFPDDLGASP